MWNTKVPRSCECRLGMDRVSYVSRLIWAIASFETISSMAVLRPDDNGSVATTNKHDLSTQTTAQPKYDRIQTGGSGEQLHLSVISLNDNESLVPILQNVENNRDSESISVHQTDEQELGNHTYHYAAEIRYPKTKFMRSIDIIVVSVIGAATLIGIMIACCKTFCKNSESNVPLPVASTRLPPPHLRTYFGISTTEQQRVRTTFMDQSGLNSTLNRITTTDEHRSLIQSDNSPSANNMTVGTVTSDPSHLDTLPTAESSSNSCPPPQYNDLDLLRTSSGHTDSQSDPPPPSYEVVMMRMRRAEQRGQLSCGIPPFPVDNS